MAGSGNWPFAKLTKVIDLLARDVVIPELNRRELR